MKRSSFEVAGGPRLREARPAVAGRPAIIGGVDVFSMVVAAPVPTAVTREEAELLTDFADFMSEVEEGDSAVVPTSDPTFRDRLRRRLWRSFVVGYLRGGSRSTH